ALRDLYSIPTRRSSDLETFGSTKTTSRIVAIPLINPEAIIAVDARSGASNAAYSADNTPIVYIAVIIIFTKNNLTGISLILVSFKYENLGKLECVRPRLIYCRENNLLNKDGTEPFSSDK